MVEQVWDVEGAVPYNCELRSTAAKSLSLFAGFTLFNGIGKSGAEIFSPTPLYCFFYFCVLFYFSVPLEHNSGQLCSFLTPHSSLTSLLTYSAIASSISFTSSPNIASASLIG